MPYSRPMQTAARGHCGRYQRIASRREWLERAGLGCGMLALSHLCGRFAGADSRDDSQPKSESPLAPRPSPHTAKARAVIWLFMEGAPSAVDLFDPKPELDRRDGQKIPIDVFFGNPGPLMKSPFHFRQYGESGAWVCDRYPHVAKHVDEIAFIKSCYSEPSDHVPALYQINTGIPRPGFPSAGSWITYGLGTENENLPGFVVLGNRQGVKGGPLNWSAGFLPTTYQGTLFRAEGDPILNLRQPPGLTRDDQRRQIDLIDQLNEDHRRQHPGEPDLLARIQSFELAYRMQTEAAELVDLSDETAKTREMYGIDDSATQSFGTKCLLARRMIERGVRFVQVYSDGEWDAHSGLTQNHTEHCRATDVAIDGLMTDLRQRGLLDSTLVIWGGEFGRMPVSQNGDGRDHNPHSFLTWMAGAGIKPGMSYGESDEIGFKSVIDRVSVHDLHATMLHLLGIDHEQLTFLHNGRRYRLTDIAGEVLQKILA